MQFIINYSGTYSDINQFKQNSCARNIVGRLVYTFNEWSYEFITPRVPEYKLSPQQFDPTY